MKKVLILCDDDKGGGTANVARHLALGLSDRFALVFGYNRHQASDLYFQSVSTIDTEIINSHCAESNRFRSTYKTSEASEIINRTKPDAILFIDAGTVYSHIALKKEASRRRIPYVTVINGMPTNTRKLQRPLLTAAIEALNGAQHIVFVSAANLERFKRLFPEVKSDLVAIPNACAADFFAPVSPIIRDERRRELGTTPQEILVLITGRVEPKKGQELAIRALAQLKERHQLRDVKLALAGTARDDYEPALSKLCKRLGVDDQVLMLGYRSDVRDLLAAADVFCLPSYAEGMPISIIEAMAVGRPIVATAIDGIPEQVDGAAGILVCPPQTNEDRCIRELADAFSKLRRSEAIRLDLAAAAHQRALDEFHPSINIERYIQLIQPLTETTMATPDQALAEEQQPRQVSNFVTFRSPQQAWTVLDSGWGATRRRGVWSEGHSSSLTIRICSKLKHPLISLRLEPHLRDPTDAQHVEVLVDGETLGIVALLRKPLNRPYWLHLHLAPSPTDRDVRVNFHFGATSPHSKPGPKGRSVLVSRLHMGDLNAAATRLATKFLRKGLHLKQRNAATATRLATAPSP